MLASRCGSTRLAARVATNVLLRGGARAPARCLASVLVPVPVLARVSVASLPLQCRHFSSPGEIVVEKVPGFGAESITEGTILEIKKSVGEGVMKGDVIAVIETDKVTVEVNAVESGTVKEIIAKIDDTVEVGASLMKIEVGEPPAGSPAASAPPSVSASAAVASAAVSTPAAATPAATTDVIDLSKQPSGLRAGFAYAHAVRAGKVPEDPAADAGAPAEPRKITVTGRGDRRVPLNLVRKVVAMRLKEAQNTAALLTTFNEVDMTEALALRAKYSDLFEKTHGAQLGLLSMIVKASSAALQEIPGVNGMIDDGTGEIVYRDYSDISVPIPSPRGIVSCTLADCHKTSLKSIELKIADLMANARKDELSLADMASPTFGLVDSGSAGGMLGTTIINAPCSAIMGTNAVTQRAAVVNGKVVARPMMYISLTYDHRLIDGREAVLFLVSVRDKLEDPVRLLFDL